MIARLFSPLAKDEEVAFGSLCIRQVHFDPPLIPLSQWAAGYTVMRCKTSGHMT